MAVQEDAAIIHFGEFLRSRVMARGRITEVAKSAGLNLASLYRFFRAKEPEPLRIENYNKLAAAKAAGFTTWEEFDAAWRVTPVVPVERRSARPSPLAQHRAAHGQIKPANITPAAIIAAIEQVESHESLVLIAKALPAEVLAEALRQPNAESDLPPGITVAKGILLNYQLEALAGIPDIESFEGAVKLIRKQLKERGKQ